MDEAFVQLPLRTLADAALDRARQLGASDAQFRFEHDHSTFMRVRDNRLEGSIEGEDAGLGIRVVVDGTWGFAATVERTPEAAADATERAVEAARTCRPLSSERVELAAEPVYTDAEWISAYEVDPFAVTEADRLAVLVDWSERLLASPSVEHTEVQLIAVRENKFYADLAGTSTTQQRVRLYPTATAIAVDATTGAFETMRTLAPPVGRGWEYMTGTGWDWDAELAQIPDWLAEKVHAPSVKAGVHDIVIDPSNLWLTIHESIGHATELDRALGYEAAYAGTSFATLDKLGSLQYGSSIMHVTGDRVAEHGLATVGYDDEGVAAQSWDLIRDGILVGYQLDRHMATMTGVPRSNGCAFAEAARYVPVQRMANVSLQPAAGGPSTPELLDALGDGIYAMGDRSWSIDMQRYNFQFTAQRFFRVRGGRIVGQLRDVAYQGTTTEFWGSMEAVGGPQTYVLGGAINCGKAQPGQAAPVSHGCPSALFRGVRILNTVEEAGR
jgi:TldD protein